MSAEAPEEWRPVVGYEGLYEVSSHGRVKQLERSRTHYSGVQSVYPEKLKATTPNKTGHHMTHLTKGSKRSGKLVHRLVLEAFVGPPPRRDSRGLHWDDNPGNNSIANLRWGTSQDNQEDAIRNGRNPNVNKTHCSRGHEYTEQNTYRVKGTRKRHCKTCRDSWRYRTEVQPTHGALSTYTNRRCRCGPCKTAQETYSSTGVVITVAEIKDKPND